MEPYLTGRKIAFLATDGVEQVELTEPWQALERAGARPELISLRPGRIQGVHGQEKGDTFPVDRVVGEVRAEEYDALVLPGGVANPDTLRTDPRAVQLVREFFAQNKPIGAICHGPWMLVEADIVRFRRLTSWPSLRTDICNAGGEWVDEEVCQDGLLVTSRKPADLPAFIARLAKVIAEAQRESAPAAVEQGPHEMQPGHADAAVDVSVADSFPASDSPSSLRQT